MPILYSYLIGCCRISDLFGKGEPISGEGYEGIKSLRSLAMKNYLVTGGLLSVVKDVRVHALITCIKLGIPIYFIDDSEFITVQCKKILSRADNEIKCFEFSSIKRALRPHLRTIIAI